MKLFRKRGSTSNIIVVFLPDSSSTTGAGKTGLTSSSAGLNISVRRELSSAVTTYSAAGSTTETITTLGTFATPTATKCRFKEVDSTNQPGLYELQFADAIFDASDASRYITGMITATGIAPTPLEIQLVAIDVQDAVRLGITALPNANAAASGGLPILGTNATSISFTAGMTISNASGDALTISSSGSNGNGIAASGNGSGSGIKGTGGATGRGIYGLGGATSGSGIRAEAQAGTSHGLHAIGANAGHGFSIDAGATGNGVNITGGATSGVGVNVTTTSGDGLSITPTAGNAVTLTANGTSKHGVVITGGTGGTSDGLKLVAGTGGVGFRLDTLTASGAVAFQQTFAITGNTTFTGSISATNASNDIRGILLQATQTGVTIPTVTSVTNQLSGSTIAAAVWDLATSGHTTSGTFGAAVVAAGSAGDPWATLLPGSYGAGTAGKIVGDNLNATVSSRSSHSAADVWAVGTRLLTAGTNIVLAKGTGITGFNDLDAAGVRSSVGLSTANLDTQIALLATASALSSLTTTVGAAGAGLTAIPKTGYKLASDGIDAILAESSISASAALTDDAGTQLTSINARQALSLGISALSGVLAGAASTSITIKPAGLPSGNTRITATVDADGNRSALTLKVPT